jgi:hypothetical protein
MTQTIINLGTGGAALNGQNGSTAGADSNDARFLDWPGVAGNYVYLAGGTQSLSVPDEAALDIAGDIDLRVFVAPDDWTPAADGMLIGKVNFGGNNMAYLWQLNANGTLTFGWSTTTTDQTYIASTVATAFTDGEAKWLRVTFDVDNGASGRTCKFFTSDDAVTWTQLGADVVQAGTTSIANSSQALRVGNSGIGNTPFVGKVYRAEVWNGIEGSGGTKVLDIDISVITSGSATSFTALTGQTVTINRSTSGRKSVAVVSPVWLFGTDDYMQVANNALINFGAGDSFTLVAIHRPWATQGTNDTLIAKKANTTNTTSGYNLSGGSSTALQGQAQMGDGTAGITAVSGSRTSGQLTVTAAVRNVTSDNLIVYLNGTAGTAVTDTTTGSINSADVFRIGRLSGAGTEYADMELLGVAIFRRALTASEITALTTYYQNRLT